MNRNQVLISGKNMSKVFGYGLNKTTAVNDVTFKFHEGEIISIVGESGSGKTTGKISRRFSRILSLPSTSFIKWINY
jgi:ABC-type oligopeptide transport system ATPase subunit